MLPKEDLVCSSHTDLVWIIRDLKRGGGWFTYGGSGLKGPPMGDMGRIIPPRMERPLPLMFLITEVNGKNGLSCSYRLTL